MPIIYDLSNNKNYNIFSHLKVIIFTAVIKCSILNSQGHNLYKLKRLSLGPVKIADNFKENNLFALRLKIVSSKSNLQSLII